MKICALVFELHLPQKIFHTHTDRHIDRQRDRYFPEILKSCSGHPKIYSSIKPEIKNLHETSTFFFFIEESKKA